MKHFAIATMAALGMAAIAAPAPAAQLNWEVEYDGWWEDTGGGSIFGSFTADEADAVDGIVALDEISSWMWSWSGNDAVSAFSISSADAGAEIQSFDPDNSGFYGDGTPNLPGTGLDQGIFVGGPAGKQILDLEFLTVEDNSDVSFALQNQVSAGNLSSASGSVHVSEPAAVPEPATVMGLLMLAVGGAAVKRQAKYFGS